MRNIRLFASLLFLLLYGCASSPKPQFNEAMTADEIQFRLRNILMSIKDFSAEGTITVNSPTMNQSAGFEMSVRKLDSVKLNIYGPFGITVGSALLTRKEFTAYNALNNTVYRGSPEKQMRMLPFVKDIPLELFVGALQGVHLVRPSQIDSFEVRAGRFYHFTTIRDDGSYDKYLYSEEFQRITKYSRMDSEGSPLWIVRYWYKHIGNGIIIPEQAEIEIPKRESSLIIEYVDASYDKPLPEFSIAFPDDAQTVTIE